MTEELTDYIEAYLLHDPIGNTEGVIAEYDPDKLMQAEANGAIFIAVHGDGRREVVKAASIHEPEPRMNGVTLTKPEYVDARTQATVAVFDALAQQMAGGAMLTADGSGAESPFEKALAALRALAYPNSDKTEE